MHWNDASSLRPVALGSATTLLRVNVSPAMSARACHATSACAQASLSNPAANSRGSESLDLQLAAQHGRQYAHKRSRAEAAAGQVLFNARLHRPTLLPGSLCLTDIFSHRAATACAKPSSTCTVDNSIWRR